jgi:hypothetical protein
MLNGDAATYRTQDMLRASEAHRVSRETAARHAKRRNARIRRAASVAIALLPVPSHR